jgi:hypothetical protein
MFTRSKCRNVDEKQKQRTGRSCDVNVAKALTVVPTKPKRPDSDIIEERAAVLADVFDLSITAATHQCERTKKVSQFQPLNETSDSRPACPHPLLQGQQLDTGVRDAPYVSMRRVVLDGVPQSNPVVHSLHQSCLMMGLDMSTVATVCRAGSIEASRGACIVLQRQNLPAPLMTWR